MRLPGAYKPRAHFHKYTYYFQMNGVKIILKDGRFAGEKESL